MALRHEELTSVIIASIFEVHNDVGAGLDEAPYHQSLLDCFLRKGVPATSKARKHLEHRGIAIRRFELDLLVFEKIILALKSVECDFLQNHYQRNPLIQDKYQDKLIHACKAKALCIAGQILCGLTAIQDKVTLFDVKRMRTYLKYSNIPLGLLLNFGKSNLEIKAILCD